MYVLIFRYDLTPLSLIGVKRKQTLPKRTAFAIKTRTSIPFFKITVFFTLGIVLAHLSEGVIGDLNYERILWPGLGIALFLLLTLPFLKNLPISGMTLIALVLLLGFLRHSQESAHLNMKQKLLSEASAIITKSSQLQEEKRIDLEVLAYQRDEKWNKISCSLRIHFSGTTKLCPDSFLLLKRTQYQIPQFENNPLQFDYPGWLKQKDILVQAWAAPEDLKTVRISGLKNSPKQLAFLASLKQSLLRKLEFLDGDEYAFASAILLGSREHLREELRSKYASSGAMHILAVSGLHVGIIFLILQWIFRIIPFSRRFPLLIVCIQLVFLWAYALISGLSPSVVRATFMFSVIGIGSHIRPRQNSLNSCLFSCFIMLLLKPFWLFDVGFQLSYSAVCAILLLYKPLKQLFKSQNILLSWCIDLILISVCAQIGTLPFSLYYFQQFPLYFLLTNFIAIPAAALSLYSGFAYFVLSSLPLEGDFLIYHFQSYLEWMFSMINEAIGFMASLPHAVLSYPGGTNSWILPVWLSFAISLLILRCIKAFRILLIYGLCFLLSFALLNRIKADVQKELVVFNHPFKQILYLRSGPEQVLIGEEIVAPEDDFRLGNFLKSKKRGDSLKVLPIDSSYIGKGIGYRNGVAVIGGSTICVAHSLHAAPCKAFLYLSAGFPDSIRTKSDAVILTSGRIPSEIHHKKLNFEVIHNCSRDGAYTKKWIWN